MQKLGLSLIRQQIHVPDRLNVPICDIVSNFVYTRVFLFPLFHSTKLSCLIAFPTYIMKEIPMYKKIQPFWKIKKAIPFFFYITSFSTMHTLSQTSAVVVLQLCISLLIAGAIATPLNILPSFNKTSTLTTDPNEHYEDCRTAILTLPDDSPGVPLPTRFSRNPDLGDYSLPQIAIFGSCAIEVYFVEDASQDKSSWVEISIELAKLNQVCREGEMPGAKATVGRHNYIELWLYDLHPHPHPQSAATPATSRRLLR